MTQYPSTQTVDHAPIARLAPMAPFDDPVERNTNLWTTINDRLRGRWIWVILFGSILSVALAVAGYMLAPVEFASRGIVKVDPYNNPVVEEIPETGTLMMYQPFMQTQAGLIGGERIVSMAVTELREKGYDSMDDVGAIAAFSSNLDVSTARNSFLIQVVYESPDPQLSMDAVNAVLDAYISVDPGDAKYSEKWDKLNDLKQEKAADIDFVESQKAAFLAESQFARLPMDDQLARMSDRLDEFNVQKANLERTLESANNGEDIDPEAAAVLGPTDQELDEIDQSLPQIRNEVNFKETQIKQMQSRLGSNARPLREARRDLAALQAVYEAKVDAAHKEWFERRDLTIGSPEEYLEYTNTQIAELQTAIERLHEEQATLDGFNRRLALLNEELEDRDDDIERFQAEEEAVRKGRISVFSEGTRPDTPSTDRRMQLAAAGFVSGLAIPFCLFFLIGTLDRRAYATAQLNHTSEFDCLGVLPDMSAADMNDEDTRDLANQCVHRIRNRIEILRRPGSGFVLTVTSPAQGDGKTSLAMALGWSYAASGYKTILVDCDFIGRSLSLQTDQLGLKGVKDAIADGKINFEINKLNHENLSVCGIGMNPKVGSESVRRSDFERLFEQLREQFEIIVIDTGPMLASVEALPITSCVDGVVLAFRRGRSQRRLTECIQELKNTTANYLGVVFNCANQSECVRYSSVSRMSKEIEEFDDEIARGARPRDSRPTDRREKNNLVEALQPRPQLPSADDTSRNGSE